MAGGATTVFIGTQYLRDNSIINDNVDEKVLGPLIRLAQDKYIQAIVGSNLYNALILQVIAGSVTGDYKILLEEYIMPTLIQYAVYESIPYLNFKFRNKSISKQTSDTSVPVELAELSYMRENVQSTAQFYAERMSVYLRLNSTLYPEFMAGLEDMAPTRQNYFGGIHIPRKHINWNVPITYDGYGRGGMDGGPFLW